MRRPLSWWLQVARSLPLSSVSGEYTPMSPPGGQWNKNISSEEIGGEFVPGSVIHCGVRGGDARFPAVIELVKPQQLTVWSGANAGSHGIHGFMFTPRGDRTAMTTAESWLAGTGPHAVAPLQDFLKSWLRHMKAAAEKAR
ncbi:hypothetical protein QFW82_46575 [Streptomyces malaysiensis subsp. malaysiensis]|uniref:hypothetical protein n=1 Tax=Streptomyces malaysiensis TaxID=92644 RepID=UPI0024BFF5BF|nr:hypothetical protein [Streptomyces sp. NA07423]WHX23964.1 hypothetical protein QFW82_46575 [Streptomyces sp. NA07423]